LIERKISKKIRSPEKPQASGKKSRAKIADDTAVHPR